MTNLAATQNNLYIAGNSSKFCTIHINRYNFTSTKVIYSGRPLGVEVDSVLATGPKACGFEPGQGDGILRAINIRSISSSRMGSKAGRSRAVRFYGM
jgi:hypothetical protein